MECGMISLRQLRYFDAVARTGNFTEAAGRCAVTQPALSMQIQELERTLDMRLIERSRRGVVLTEPGREIARRAAGILTGVRDIVDYARSQGELAAGPLHLGVIPSIAPYALPALLPRIHEAMPDLDLRLRETQTEQLVRELIDGQLDLLLLALPVANPEIETLRLFDDHFLLAMPASRQIDHAILATPELIAHDRLLLLEEGHCLRDQALAFCSLRRIDNFDTFGASSLSTIVQMVANKLGMTLLPELCLALEAHRADIRLMRFAEPQPKRTVGLAWRRSSPRRHHYAELGALITEATSAQMQAAARL
jgi:LysR family hydrogen peroxide-inducible transcriptional activator